MPLEEANAPSNVASDTVQPSPATTVTPVADAGQAQQPVADDKPSGSAREAVEKAMAKMAAPEGDKPKTDAAAAKTDTSGRQHGPDGKFVAKPKEGEAATEAKPKSETPPKQEQQPSAAVVGQAPQRFSKAAQEAWPTTPEPVRVDVERALTELTQGIEKHRAAATAFEPIAKFDQMARASGTTLAEALTAYTNIETLMRRDPIAGLITVCRNMGVDPRTAGAALAQMQGVQRQGDTPEVAALKNEIAQLRDQVGGLGTTFAERQAQTVIDQFATAHPFVKELENDIAFFIETKRAKDLPEAYDLAVRLNPEIAAKIEADKAAKEAALNPPKASPDPAQLREKAALSTTGSPASGSTPSAAKPASSPREALERAFAQA